MKPREDRVAGEFIPAGRLNQKWSTNHEDSPMNYVPGYGYDIFVSYAQVDDLTGRDDEDGWVSAPAV